MEREKPEKIYSWLGNFESTLSSPEGSKALESYLVHHDSLSMLEFIWACDGMKNLVEENPSKADDLVTCIYKNYIISGSLPILSNNVVMSIAKQFEAYFERLEPGDYPATVVTQPVSQLDLSIFDNAKTEVEIHLENQIFPLFQEAVRKGEVYVGVRSTGCTSITHTGMKNGCQAGASSSLSSSSSRLASHPDEFAKKLCEKLEDLMRTKDQKPP